MNGCHGQCQNGGTCRVKTLQVCFLMKLSAQTLPPCLTAICVFSSQDGTRGGYHCQCPPGFVGTHCEIQRNKCASGPCQNGARCHVVLDSFVCECLSGYAGPLCEVSSRGLAVSKPLLIPQVPWLGLSTAPNMCGH